MNEMSHSSYVLLLHTENGNGLRECYMLFRSTHPTQGPGNKAVLSEALQSIAQRPCLGSRLSRRESGTDE